MANNDINGRFTMSDAQMPEWTEICKAFAKKQNAKLVFVNNTSCGLEYTDGTHQHVTIQGMADFLEEHGQEDNAVQDKKEKGKEQE